MKMKTRKMRHAKINNIMNYYSIIQSPIGELMLVADDSALTGLYFADCEHVPAGSKRGTLNAQHAVLQQAAEQLEEYFTGIRERFSVPIHLNGTDFQQSVWREIERIPYGETLSYSDLAKRAGAPRAIRAAGTTTGQNPVSIIIPCHRVMGKNGGLCGFAGGLERKQHLLELENFRGAYRWSHGGTLIRNSKKALGMAGARV